MKQEGGFFIPKKRILIFQFRGMGVHWENLQLYSERESTTLEFD